MDLYKELSLTPVKSEPNAWISRLVIFDRIAPHPVKIQDIPLTRGMNIIWAEETDDDDPAAEIGGHSAGKTTFCRFLRYVLGEKTFGTKTNMELIRKSFPEGYVAAELHVAGQKWAVQRPLGNGRMSYFKQDATVEEQVQDRGQSVSQDDYPKKIGLEDLVDELESGAIVRTGETIYWAHVLAWCTRDQEARFQNIHEWRSARSESEAPAFRFAKTGPLFLMRTALGLFLPDELKAEEKLGELQREKERLEKEIEEKRREPQFRVNLYEYELRRRLRTFFPNEQGIDKLPLHSGDLLPDLHRLTESAISEVEQVEQRHERERADVQSQIDDVGARIQQHENDLAYLDTLFSLNTAAVMELDEALSGRQEQREQLKEHAAKMCPFGGVLIQKCSYVVNRQNILQITQLQDVREMERAEGTRTEEVQKIEREKLGLRENIQNLRQQIQGLQATRGLLRAKQGKQREELLELRQARESLETWTQRSAQGLGYEELSRLREKLDEINREIEGLDKELTNLLSQHDQNRELLASIFSAAVRSVLSSGRYDGQVTFSSRELAFRITHGPAMSGEAVETLSVLLSDITSLIYNTVSDAAHLPGLMLHDSPREADLGIRIYRSFIRFVASLPQHFGGNDNCPFQYILTTTTPPPEELRTPQYVKLPLNASKLDGLLLRRNIAEPRNEDAALFDS